MQFVGELKQVVHELSQKLHLFKPLSMIEKEPSKESQIDFSIQLPSV